MNKTKLFALVDCNNFYASCERVFRPELRHQPVVVLSNNDGCIIARSEEAKALGIEMGVPHFEIKPLIKKHKVHVFSSNYALYGDLSARVMNILQEHCAEVEIYSIDESFLVLDFYDMHPDKIWTYCKNLRNIVYQGTGIPVSVGVAATKTLAKLANHIAKRVTKKQVHFLDVNDTLLKEISISKVWGIGAAYKRRLGKINVHTVHQLQQVSESWMQMEFGIVGLRMLKELKGIPCLKLEAPRTERKNMVVSRSFEKDIYDLAGLCEAISIYATRMGEKLRHYKQETTHISVFLKANPFKKKSESRRTYWGQSVQLPIATANTNELIHWSIRMIKYIYQKGINYKKAGIMVTQLQPAAVKQIPLFYPTDRHLKNKKINAAMDAINRTMGKNTVYFSSCGKRPRFKHRQVLLSPKYTTRWKDILRVR